MQLDSRGDMSGRLKALGTSSLLMLLVAGCEPNLEVRELELAANRDGALVADRQLSFTGTDEGAKVEAHYLRGSDGTKTYWNVALGLDPTARLLAAGAAAEDDLATTSFAVLFEGPSGKLHVHGDPHVDDKSGKWWSADLGPTGTGTVLAPVSFGTFAAAVASPGGVQQYELDRKSGTIVLGTLWNEKDVFAAAGSSFGSTPGLNGNDMMQAIGVTPDCGDGGDPEACVVDVLVRGETLYPAVTIGVPEETWSDATGHLDLVTTRIHSGLRNTLNTVAVGEAYLAKLESNGGCTAAGFDVDGTPLAMRVTPAGIELFEATKTGYVPTAWKEARVVAADLDRDGLFDTVCSLAAYGGDVWLAWVELDPATGEHRNIEVRKVVDKATSGLKDVLKTQV